MGHLSPNPVPDAKCPSPYSLSLLAGPTVGAQDLFCQMLYPCRQQVLDGEDMGSRGHMVLQKTEETQASLEKWSYTILLPRWS